MTNKRRLTVLGAIAGAIVLLLVFAVVLRPKGKPLVLKEQHVAYSHFVTKLPESGFIMRPRVQTLAALVGGNIGTIFIKAGDRVSQGQLLATIVNPQVESSYHSAEAAYRSAAARMMSVRETNAALPAQNQSSVTQAKAALENAKTSLNQLRQDAANGAQSGLGYGGITAEEQRLSANAAVARADTDFGEAQRLYDANKELYANKALSRDALEASRARYDSARVGADQSHRQRDLTLGQLGRTMGLLRDRVRAAQDSVRQAEAALAAAKAVASQSKQGDVLAAVADANRAQSDYAFARDQYARTAIHAPFAGVIATVAAEPADTLRPLAPGDAIAPGAPLFTMASSGGFIARAKVDEQDISRVALGQRAIVSGEDFGSKTLSGHVTAISPVAQRSDDPSSTARQVLTTIGLEQTLPFLRDGMSVDVDIVTTDIPHAIVVPTDAIVHEKGKAFVYTVAEGKAKKRAVRTGTGNDSQTVIISGLAPGDLIIAEKSPALREGARVAPAPSASPSVSATPR